MKARGYGTAWMVGMLALVLCACGGDSMDPGGASCLTDLPTECNVVWNDFDAMWNNELNQCGASNTGPSCHSAEGRMGGLVMSDQDTAYQALLGGGPDGRVRVIPGDPACSVLMQRIDSTAPGFQMPPSGRLSDNQRCSIMRWIENGANR